MKKRKKFWIIDLGEALTKIIIGVVTESGRVEVKTFRIERTPEQFWSEAYEDKKSKLRGFFRPLLKGYRRNDKVMVLINHNEMMVATYTFPMMTLAEVEEAIYWQMQLLTSENLEHWRIDFVARERTKWFECLGMDEKKLDVLGVGVKKSHLVRHTRLFKKVGVSLESIVPQLYTFTSLVDQNEGQPTMIIDMGKHSTRLFYYNRGALIDNHQIDLEEGWDGETYLQKIIKAAEQIFISPFEGAKVGENGNIYLMGGESLHTGVLEYLTDWMDKEIWPTYKLLDEKEGLLFPGQMTKAELCLITPCVCGLIKWAQINGTGILE